MFDALDAGDVARPPGALPGPLLPQSVVPRDRPAAHRVERQPARRGASPAGDLELLRRWLDLPEGRDDRDGWQMLHDSARAPAVGRAQAGGHLAGIDFEFG